MKIKLTSVFVDDQEKALKFYTEVLGFVKKTELPTGDFKWLTVVADGRDDLEVASRTECKSSCQGVPESDPRSRNPISGGRDFAWSACKESLGFFMGAPVKLGL